MDKLSEIESRLRSIKRHGVRIFKEKEIYLITPIINEYDIDLETAKKVKYKRLTLFVTQNGLTPQKLHEIKDLIYIGPISIPEKMAEITNHFPVNERVEHIISKANSTL